VVVVGENVEEATVNAIYLEEAAKIQSLINLIGTPESLDEGYCRKFAERTSKHILDHFVHFESLLDSPIKGLH
jgi:ribulose-5-phosphate 4-epimerase/fuculose-1-phosphate aldolase